MELSKVAGLSNFWFVFGFLTLAFDASSAQTIAIKDFPRLVASVRALTEGDSVGYSGREFQSWYLDSMGGYGATFAPCSRAEGLTWLYAPRAEFSEIQYQSRHMSDNLKNRLYIIMSDGCGFESQQNALTCWQTIPGDSIRFLGFDIGDFESGIGSARIFNITIFPDSTLLFCIKDGGGDAGDFWGGFKFLREVAPCQFERFYEVHWASDNFLRVYFNFDLLAFDQYRVTEVTEYLAENPLRRGPDKLEVRPDSARAEVIDLWELAVEAFEIDTTIIKRER
ncbi:MAG: hypothetical protein WBP29_01860 [Candidatus Zixiibacteriota bacterium]